MSTLGPKQIDQLPQAVSLTGNEYLPLQYNGLTLSAQLLQIQAFMLAGIGSPIGSGLIGYKATPANSVLRTLQLKLGEGLSNTDFTTATTGVAAVNAAGGGTLLFPNGNGSATLPASTGNTVLDYAGPDVPVTMFGEAAGTSYMSQRVLRRQSSNTHTGKGQSLQHIENRAAGTGLSGPTNSDMGLSVSLLKNAFNTGGAISGELDGAYIAVRNDGADADTCGALFDVGNYGVGFNAAWESVTTGFSGGTPTQQVNAQAGVVDTRTNSQYGMVATKAIGLTGVGYFAQQTGTARWGSVMQYVTTGGMRFDMPIDSNGVPSIKLFDSAGTSKTMRINAGSFSMLNSAGGAEILSLTDAGVLTVASSASANGINSTNALTSTNPTSGVGYATGAGGTVTQATSKTTGVTLNKVSGQITMNAAALASTATVVFTLTNSTIAATDMVIVKRANVGTAQTYFVDVDQISAGSCRILVNNFSGASQSEAIVLNFIVIKAVAV